MDSPELQRFKEKLLAMRQGIAGEVASLKEEGFALGTDGTQDVADDAANTCARQMLLGLSERERDSLRQIDDALDRIEEGTYGQCEECGEDIIPARLEAVPYANLCVECKENQERGSR